MVDSSANNQLFSSDVISNSATFSTLSTDTITPNSEKPDLITHNIFTQSATLSAFTQVDAGNSILTAQDLGLVTKSKQESGW